MKRTWIVLIVLVLAVLLLVMPGIVAAEGRPFLSLYGTIDSHDCDDGEIVITQTKHGSDTYVVELSPETLYKECTEEGPGSSNAITCDDLVNGNEVRIIRDRDTLIATRVIQYVLDE